MSFIIEKDSFRVPYSGTKAEQKLIRDKRLETIRAVLNEAIKIPSSQFDILRGKRFEYIHEYRCKHFQGKPLVIKFYHEQDRLYSTGYFEWNGELYYLDRNQSCSMKLLFMSEAGLSEDPFEGKVYDATAPLLDGDKYELTIDSNSLSELPDSAWNNWMVDMKEASQEYQYAYHPAINAFASYLLRKARKPLRIWDIGAGTGDLAKQIIEGNAGQIEQYCLLEYNQKEVAMAKEKFSELIRQNVVLVHQGDATQPESLQFKNPDIIIASGFFTAKVLPNLLRAYHTLTRFSIAAPTGCYLLMTGHAPSFIHSKELVGLGWRVVNTFCPSRGICFNAAVREEAQ